MMALVAGDIENGKSLGQQAFVVADGYNELAGGFQAALMIWTWWQRDELGAMGSTLRQAIAGLPANSPSVRAGLALADAEAGELEDACAALDWLSKVGGRTSAHGARP